MKRNNKLGLIFLLSSLIMVGRVDSIKALANGYLFADTADPMAVTVTFYDDYDSRGFNWTTTIKMDNPVVQLAKSDENFTENFTKAETLPAETIITDEVYFNYKAYKTDMEEGNYIYRVGNSQHWSDVGHITISDDQDGFSFIFVTDPQEGSIEGFTAWRDILYKAKEVCPDAKFIADAGDTVNDSHDWSSSHDMDQWIMALDLPKDLLMNFVIMPASGNHESWGHSFADRFTMDYQGPIDTGGGYYAVNYGNAFFAVLNTNESGSNRVTQAAWLDKVLGETDKQWKFVLMHKGPISTGDHSRESDVAEWRNEVLPLMAKHKVDFVMQGHDHVYVRSKPYLYGKSASGGTYSGKVPNMEETYITEIENGEEISYSVEPAGTFYVTANYSGTKQYQPVDYDKSLIFPAINPLNGKAMSIQPGNQTFTTITVGKNSLNYNAYLYDRKTDTATLYDTYNLKKNTYVHLEEKLQEAKEDISIYDAKFIKECVDEYDGLVEKAKASLSEHALQTIEAYKQINIADYIAAYEVVKAIDDVKEVEATDAFAKTLKSLKGMLQDLNEDQQKLVINASKIEELEEQMMDIHYANVVSELISEYLKGNVEYDIANLAYNRLTEDQKKLVVKQSFKESEIGENVDDTSDQPQSDSPISSEEPEEDNKEEKKGCRGNINSPIAISIIGLIFGLFLVLKRRAKYEN